MDDQGQVPVDKTGSPSTRSILYNRSKGADPCGQGEAKALKKGRQVRSGTGRAGRRFSSAS